MQESDIYEIISFQVSYHDIFLFLAKVFPGQLEFSDKTYEESMNDSKSDAFKKTADEIIAKVSNELSLCVNQYSYTKISILLILRKTHFLLKTQLEIVYGDDPTYSGSVVLKLL